MTTVGPLHRNDAVSSRDALLTAPVLGLYRLLGRLAMPWLRRHLVRRQARGREDPLRLGERLGHAGQERPPGPLLWIHGASVGEALSALPLIKRIGEDAGAPTLLMTTGTVTSARLMGQRLPPGVIHQYAPIDVPQAAARFLDHWQPTCGLILESELWPNLLTMACDRGIEMGLVNGRMSAHSFRSWRRFAPLPRRLLGGFDLVLAQSAEDRERLAALGARAPQYHGNLKFAAEPLPHDPAALEALRDSIGQRHRWLAASTHPGEEAFVGDAHRALSEKYPDLLTIVVPRHPDRGDRVAEELRNIGLTVAQRSRDEPITGETDIYLADSVGELGLWYRLAEVVFVGKSLVSKGGQNPLEPAQLDSAIIVGPDMSNFGRLADELAAAGGLCRIDGPAELPTCVDRLLSDGGARRQLMTAAKAYATAQAGCLDDIYTALKPLIDRARRPEALQVGPAG